VSVEDEVGGKMDKLGILFAGALRQEAGSVSVDGVWPLRLVFAEIDARVRGAIEEQCWAVVGEEARHILGFEISHSALVTSAGVRRRAWRASRKAWASMPPAPVMTIERRHPFGRSGTVEGSLLGRVLGFVVFQVSPLLMLRHQDSLSLNTEWWF